jgi:hypothetical protein
MRYKFLPNEYRISHEFAFYLHDLLANTVAAGEEMGIFDVRFRNKSPEDAAILSSLDGEDLWKWLDDNGYRRVTDELIYKRVIIALLADLCHFVYEALSCSAKCKLTVAYSLLRKPLKDNLFCLEWLLADPQGFIRTFRATPEKTASGSVSEDRKFAIIKGARAKTEWPDWISADLVHDLRYKKALSYGFEGLWNKAIHLVTTCKPYATEQMNFNFVFSGHESHLGQWNHFYTFVPLLLCHSVQVVDALLSNFTHRDDFKHSLGLARTLAGLALWADSIRPENERIPSAEIAREMMNDLQLDCPACSHKVKFNRRSLESLYRHGEFVCAHCRTRISIDAPNGEDEVRAIGQGGGH